MASAPRFHTLLDAFHAGGGEIELSSRYTEALAFLKELKLDIADILDIPSCLDKASFARSLDDVKLTIDMPSSSALRPPGKPNPTFPFHKSLNLHILRLHFHQPMLGKSTITPLRDFLELSTLPPSLQKLHLNVTMHFDLTIGVGGILGPFEVDNVRWDLSPIGRDPHTIRVFPHYSTCNAQITLLRRPEAFL